MHDYASKEHFFDKEGPLYRKPRATGGPPGGRKFLRIGFKIISYGFFLATLFTLGYWGLQMMESLPYFAIKEVVLEGGKHINAEELANLAGISPRQNLLGLNLRQARYRILQNPWVEEVSVRRRFPQTVVITVKEREPAGIVEVANSGKRFLISAEGIVLEEVKAGRNFELPLIMGINRWGTQVGAILPYENLTQSLVLISKINAHRPEPLGRLKEAHIRPDGSLILTCTRLSAPLYVKSENFAAQWPLFLQFLDERANKKTAYEYIDLRFADKVVTKPYRG
jgi:hypothetical protein